MLRTLLLSLTLLALTCVPAGAQLLDEGLVPKGRFRVRAAPSFSSWDQRFGRSADGVDRTESLGDDLTDETGVSLFPAIADLETEIRALTGIGDFSGLLGAAEGYVNQDVTRIDFGGHLGVFDWLTVGVIVPWVKTRSAVEVAFTPDTVNGTLGLNPTITNTDGVISFLDALSTAQSAVQTRADALCASGPGAAGCGEATSLLERVGAVRTAAERAYFASGFFPMQGTPAAEALGTVSDGLNTDLVAAGLSELFAPMVFATDWLTADALVGLPAQGPSGLQAQPLQGTDPLWAVGDIEVSALARVLAGEVRDSGAAAPSLRYAVHVGGVARLGTGTFQAQDVFLDVGTGDAQMDYEGRVSASLVFGSRLAVRAGVRYGVQQSLSLLRRVAAPEVAMPSSTTLRAVRWSPASYLGFEAEPGVRLSDELSLTGHYRMFDKGTDAYEMIGDPPAGSRPVDIAVLGQESGVSLHQVGLGVRYSTVPTWQAGEHSRAIEMHARVVRAIAGSGGHTPRDTRVEVGISLFRGIWGGS